MDHYNTKPINPLPPVVWALVVPIALIELVLSVSGGFGAVNAIGWRAHAIEATAFSGTLWDHMIETSTYSATVMLRVISYIFVHIGPMHTLFVCVFTLALGKFVGEVYRTWAVLAVFFISAAAGALAYGVLTDAAVPLIGGYPATYGLIGAFTFILWTRLGAQGLNRSSAFLLIGVLLVYQIIFGAFGVLFYNSVDFLWIADLVGFATGFLLSFVVSPGGWQRVLEMVRQR